jgi:FixJ family two-component response regulator
LLGSTPRAICHSVAGRNGREQAACVILDINLNDGSGIELGQGLKAAGVAVPVIFITGNENPTVREAAVASGCVAFLTKPFSARELIEPINRVIGQSGAQ